MKASRAKKTVIANNEIKWWGWATLGVLTVFFMLSPFYVAFFNGEGLHGSNQFLFEKSHYYGLMVGILGLFIMAAFTLLNKARVDNKDIIAVLGAIIPLCYWVSSWSAVSPYLARIEWFNSIALYAFFLMGMMLSSNTTLQKYFIRIYFVIGSILVMFGFSYLFGNNYKLDALQYIDGVRLASIFTYPNAFAAFLMTLLIISILEITLQNRSNKATLAYSFMLVPIVTSLLITLSRGAIIMLPLIALVTLLFQNLKRQIDIMLLLIFSFVLSLFLQGGFSTKGTKVFQEIQHALNNDMDFDKTNFFNWNSFQYWSMLLISSLVMTGIVYTYYCFIDKRMESKINRWNTRYSSRFLIPILFIVIGVISIFVLQSGILNAVLPEQLSDRLGSITYRTHSVLERLVFYKNSIEIWREHPLIGGGGGAWEALYEQVQPYPYMSSQVHSYIFQVLTSIGIIGFIFIGCFFIYIIYNFIKAFIMGNDLVNQEKIIFFLIAISILIHSMIDFEMSYLFFSGIVFLCLGMLTLKSKKSILSQLSEKSHLLIKRGSAIIWLVIAIIVYIGIFNGIKAVNKYNETRDIATQGRPFAEVVNTINSGLKAVPVHPYLLELLSAYYAQAYEQTNDKTYADEADKNLKLLLKEEPRFINAYFEQLELQIKLGKTEDAARLATDAVDNYPYQIRFYDYAMKEQHILWTKYKSLGDQANQDETGSAILKLYEKALMNREKLKEVPKEIGYNQIFNITEQMTSIYDEVKKETNKAN